MRPYVVNLIYSNRTMDLMLLDNITVRVNINKIKSYHEMKEKPSIYLFWVTIF